MLDKLLQACTAVLVFDVIILLSLDLHMFVVGGQTLSSVLQSYFGASEHSFRVALMGFVIGALLTHFTRWK